ncbi:MAG: beta-ketoacyl-[acyl-carrier-protein] synthase family protein [Pseudodesulfovibrio sp.]|nr:beta-ketoacyl-[acyl-carrier-protein] synthase family protein [Pseudodesulfovibrio sp.]
MSDLGTINIIGAACICAAGATLDDCMDSMLAKRGAPVAPSLFKCELTEIYPVFEVPNEFINNSSPHLTRTANLLRATVDDAFTGSGISHKNLESLKVGVCIGTSVGASLSFLDFYRTWKQGRHPELDPIHRYLKSNPADIIVNQYALDGPSQTVVNACTSGTDAIGIGASWIRHGLCDIVIAGGTDELSEISYNGFASLKITSPEPCRPFDKDRSGLNLGEGAGVLLLASDNAVDKLSPRIRGKVLGYGTFGDAHHLTAPHPKARGLKMALKAAFKNTTLGYGDIDFINVHGTGTPTNDHVEGLALQEIFPTTPYSATKGFTGHTLGAAGAIEAAFTLACMERGELPPSKGFAEVDPGIGCRPIAERTQKSCRYALSQSLAFGGNNSVLILEGGEGI